MYTESIDSDDSNARDLESIGFGNDYRLSESGNLDGYGKDGKSEKLGRLNNSSKNESERRTRVGGVGQI